MKKTFFLVLIFCWAGVMTGKSVEPLVAKVIGERVNVRAKPEFSAEVVGQLSDGEELQVKKIDEEWVEIIPPDHFDLWAHRDFVQEDTVTVKELNVRAGPGINYTVVGTLHRGDKIIVRGSFGEWIQLAPFKEASLWVSKEYLKINLPPPPKKPVIKPAIAPANPPPVVAIQTSPPPTQAVEVKDEKVGPPADLKLVPLEGQGSLVIRKGMLKPSPFLFGRPSAYRLVREESNHLVTLCYVRGDTKQLRELLNRYVSIKGREYWIQGVRPPVLVMESLEDGSAP